MAQSMFRGNIKHNSIFLTQSEWHVMYFCLCFLSFLLSLFLFSFLLLLLLLLVVGEGRGMWGRGLEYGVVRRIVIINTGISELAWSVGVYQGNINHHPLCYF